MRLKLAIVLTLPLASSVALATLVSFGSAGCIGVQLGGQHGDAGASSSSASAAGSGDAGADATAHGVDCILEATTGATLCSGISLCPGLMVDHDLYPHCGFRPKGNVLDIECACNGDICPVGVPTTCTQAVHLLESQSGESQVCAQVAEGRCTPGTSATGGSTTSPTCDRTCSSECGGDPSCIKLCGC